MSGIDGPGLPESLAKLPPPGAPRIGGLSPGRRHPGAGAPAADRHGEKAETDLATALPRRCRETDRATAALIPDRPQGGLPDTTLVAWGREFGRTPMDEERGTPGAFRDVTATRGRFTTWGGRRGAPGRLGGEHARAGLHP